jgi:hypothetical protein
VIVAVDEHDIVSVRGGTFDTLEKGGWAGKNGRVRHNRSDRGRRAGVTDLRPLTAPIRRRC